MLLSAFTAHVHVYKGRSQHTDTHKCVKLKLASVCTHTGHNKVSHLLTLQSCMLQKQTFNLKQRPLQCSPEACSLYQQDPLTLHWPAPELPVWNLSVRASRQNFVRQCFDVVLWNCVWVKISNHVSSLCPQQHWLVESEQRRGLPVVACHPGIGSGGKVIEYWSVPSPAVSEVMWILWLSTA